MVDESFRLFVSSPGDVRAERHRVELVTQKLNREFQERAKIEAVLWEDAYYSAHETFQAQIPEAAACDAVVAIFRARLGSPLPDRFPRLPTGEAYPSGTAYEVLTAIQARRSGAELPDIYVFRYPNPPSVTLDSADTADEIAQWEKLKRFFDAWFRNRAGEFLAASQEYASVDDLARKVEDCLRQWLARHGYTTQPQFWDRNLKGSPFPGLAAFEADRQAVFFGRDLAIDQAIGRLRRAGASGDRVPFLLLIGPSGAGKSSLLRAGLIPRIMVPGAIPEVDTWRSAVALTGSDPFLALAECLLAEPALGRELREGAFETKELLAKQLAADPDAALAPLRAALALIAERRRAELNYDAVRSVRLLLGIDQAERLFAEADPKTASAFAAFVAALVRGGFAYVVFALRSDAYAHFQAFGSLVALRDAGATFDLTPPGPAELEEIVTKPVAACVPALAFEEKDGGSLAAALVGDAKEGDTLPLLQMTLARLYSEEAARGDGLLRFADYRGMEAAVTETANEALDTLSTEARAELAALVRSLVRDVSVDPLTGTTVPVVEALNREEFETSSPTRKALVDAFVARRLLTTEGDAVSQRVRPVHDALMRIWPQAVEIVVENASLIHVRRILEPIVRDWGNASGLDKPTYLDISAVLLSGAQRLVRRFGEEVPKAMREFVVAATNRAQEREAREKADQERRIRDAEALATANRRIARRTGIGLIVVGLLFLGAIVAGWLAHIEAGRAGDAAQEAKAAAKEAQNQRDAAVVARKDAQDQRDSALMAQSLARGSEADALVSDGEAASASGKALLGLPNELLQLRRPFADQAVTALAKALASSQPVAVLSRTGEAAAFSDDSRRFAVAVSGAVEIYRTDTWALTAQIAGTRAGIKALAFSPEGRLLAIGYDDGRTIVVDGLTGEAKLPIAALANDSPVTSLAFSRDAGKLLVTQFAGMVLADLQGGAPRIIKPGHPGGVLRGVFSPDGKYVGTVGMAAPDKSLRPDNSVKIWSASDFAPIATLSMPNWALSLAFSPDSARVAAGGDVEKVPIWSLPDGKPVDLVDLGYSNIGWLKFLNQDTIAALGSKFQIVSLDHPESNTKLNIGDVRYGNIVANTVGQAAKFTETPGLTVIDPTAREQTTNYRYKDITFQLAVLDNTGSLVAGLGKNEIIVWKLPPRISSSFSPPQVDPSNLEWWYLSQVGTPVLVYIEKSKLNVVVARKMTEEAEVRETSWTAAGLRFTRCYISGNGRRIAVVAWRGDGWSVSVAEVASGAPLKEIAYSVSAIHNVQFDKLGDHLAISYRDGTMDLYSADGGKPIAHLDVPKTFGQERGAISDDGRYIVRAGSDRQLTLVDSATGTMRIISLGGNEDLAYLSALGDVFIYQADHGPAETWDAANDRSLGNFAPPGDNLTFVGRSDSGGGRLAYATDSGSIVILDAAQKQLFNLKVAGRPTSLSFGDTEDVILIQFDDQRLEYWSLSRKIKLAQSTLGDMEGGLTGDWQSKRFRAVYTDASARNIAMPFSVGLWQSLLDVEAKSPGAIIDYGRMAALEPQTRDLAELAANAGPAQTCDALAANPFDPARTASGVAFDLLDARRALAACEAATRVDANPRLKYEYGRALAKAGRADQAKKAYQEAAASGYLYGSYILAVNAPANLEALKVLAEEGVVVAYSDIGEAHYKARDYEKALSAWSEGAAKGDPRCEWDLGRLSASGVGGHFDLDASLLHYARASILFQRLGAESEAFTRERGSLARSVSPDIVERNVQAALRETDGRP